MHEPRLPRYQQIIQRLSDEILTGKYQPGERFPSESALVKRLGTSRITIGRALRELAQRGLVERIAGSGTYVRPVPNPDQGLLFGLLIPELGTTEIFEPICRGIAAAPRAGRHALLWGQMPSSHALPEAEALDLCEQCVARRVSGVFFAPLETGETVEATNLAILSRLEEAGIPVILLDRCVMPYPARSRHDLVGIDNRRAGYLATWHLLQLGSPQVSFLATAGGAPTIEARIAGFREAVTASGQSAQQPRVFRPPEVCEAAIRPWLDTRQPGDGFICANDRLAGELMHVLLSHGLRIPGEVRIVGIDDVKYASLLPVPLTTVHQPCQEIGEAALVAMLDRMEHPRQRVRDILLECHLVIRESCGGSPRQNAG